MACLPNRSFEGGEKCTSVLEDADTRIHACLPTAGHLADRGLQLHHHLLLVGERVIQRRLRRCCLLLVLDLVGSNALELAPPPLQLLLKGKGEQRGTGGPVQSEQQCMQPSLCVKRGNQLRTMTVAMAYSKSC
jgi:hypothetical protein